MIKPAYRHQHVVRGRALFLFPAPNGGNRHPQVLCKGRLRVVMILPHFRKTLSNHSITPLLLNIQYRGSYHQRKLLP